MMAGFEIADTVLIGLTHDMYFVDWLGPLPTYRRLPGESRIKFEYGITPE